MSLSTFTLGRVYPGWWVVLACFWLAALAWGIGFYGQGVYLTALRFQNGSTSLLSLATTGYYLVGAALMIFVTPAIEHFGSRGVVLTCTLALCGSLALLPHVSAPWQMAAVYLLMAVGWAGTSWAAIPCILARWFDRRRGFAISIAFSGASAGGIIVPPLLIDLSNRYGFADAAAAVAALGSIVVGTLAALFLRRGPDALGFAIDGERMPGDARRAAATAPHAAAEGYAEPLQTARFWITTVAFSIALMTQVGFLTHQIPVLTPTIGIALAGIAVAVTAASSIFGRLALGLVVDRLDPRAVSAVAFTLQAAAIAVLTRSTAHWAVFAACVVYGLWVGNIITLPALIIQRDFDSRAFAGTIGLVTSISQFTFAFGPGLLGFLHDVTGSYRPVLVTCAALNLLASGLILARRRRCPWPTPNLRRGARAARPDSRSPPPTDC